MTGRSRADVVAAVGAATAMAALLMFLALPIVAVVAGVPPSDLLSNMTSPAALAALGVTLRTSLSALALILLLGTPTAYVLARSRSRAAQVATVLVELPLVLPPAVAGFGLLLAFGRFGLLGEPLRIVGVSIPFTRLAVVLAMVLVATPLFVRQATASFAAVAPDLLEASRTLGAGAARTFTHVVLPMSRGGVVAGAVIAWARGLGEFGATLIFAGSISGVTRTLPLAIYAELAGDLVVARAMSVLLIAVSLAVLVASRLLERR